MNGSSTKALFWCAIVAQVAGAQVFFWDALPDYRELTAGEVVAGTPTIRLGQYSRAQLKAAAVSLDPLRIEPASNSIKRAS
jgi:hypothetical protein